MVEKNLGKGKWENLERMLRNINVGDGVKINLGHSIRSSVEIGEIDWKSVSAAKNSSSAPDPHLKNVRQKTYDITREALDIAKRNGVGLRQVSYSEFNDPVSEIYVVEYIEQSEGGLR